MSDSNFKSTNSVEQKIVEIISRIGGVEVDTSIDNINYLNTDSLMRLEIMTSLENEFKITLSEDMVDQLTSISRMARLVNRMVEEQVKY